MAKIGKLTMYVEESRTGHILRVRTTGRKGALSLNTVTFDHVYDYVNPSPTAMVYWLASAQELAVLLA